MIDTFAIESDGALRYATSTNYAKHTGNSECAECRPALLRSHRRDLYIQEYNVDCANTGVASIRLEQTNRGLSYLGVDITGVFPGEYNAAYFIGNNVYAYPPQIHACMYYGIYGFRRKSNGLLVSGGASSELLRSRPRACWYVPDLLAADPTNHIAVLEQPANPPDCAAGPLTTCHIHSKFQRNAQHDQHLRQHARNPHLQSLRHEDVPLRKTGGRRRAGGTSDFPLQRSQSRSRTSPAC